MLLSETRAHVVAKDLQSPVGCGSDIMLISHGADGRARPNRTVAKVDVIFFMQHTSLVTEFVAVALLHCSCATSASLIRQMTATKGEAALHIDLSVYRFIGIYKIYRYEIGRIDNTERHFVSLTSDMSLVLSKKNVATFVRCR